MIRSLALIAALCVGVSNAYIVGSGVSGFGGSVLVTGASNVASMEMKKGKANVPPQMRQQYARQQEMASQREQMIAATKPGDDGLPVFNLFVRSGLKNMWYPCGSFKGDDRSMALCTTYRDGGLFAGMSKNQLDGGIAASLYGDLGKLKESVFRGYPQLRKSKDSLEWGYKLAFEGLDSEEITIIEPKESKGVMDNLKNMFGQ